jgi:phage tail sheath protein FI
MPNIGPFPHGVSWSDVPTSVISPVPAYPGMNVVFGSAPLHLVQNGKDFINKPRIYNRYEDAVKELGYSTDWEFYDICEHMDAVFVEFGMFPVVYVACNDPEVGAVTLAPKTVTLANGQVDTLEQLIAWTIVVKDSAGTITYVEGDDYLLTLSKANTWVITRITTGDIPAANSQLQLTGKKPTVTPITSADIIGGVDVATGARSGLEVIEDVFQQTNFIPGVIICPKFSSDPVVAAAMEAKAENINGCFACTCLIDVDTATVKTAQDVNAWKNSNNIVFPRQQCLFGKPALKSTAVSSTVVGTSTATLGDKVFNFASQQGPLLQWTDAYKGNGLPYQSPSNKNLRMNALLLEDGTELPMHLLDANMLNSQGVVTALNFIGGWRSWGNRTAAFPANTDVKDMFIPVRRMFDYIGNTIVLTIWQKVDEPGNRRLIDAVVNSLQLWLDGLASQDALLGARIEFRHDENPTTDILNGHYVFHVYIAVPTPAEWLDFRIEYWVPYIQNLWPDVAQAVA